MELTFVNNFYGKHSRVAHENGEQYLVCPVVMLVEGVHNGSNGSLFYPAAELAKKPSAWNGVPVTVYHPTINGVAVSASHPDVAPQKVGEIRNAKWDGKKLRAEAWIDTERLEEAAPELVDLIDGDAGVIEVSTGLFTDNEFQAGWFGGKNFELVARNHKPDHLAILPKGHGACSVSDGCGLFQTNEENNMHNETGLPLPTMDFGYKEPVLNAAEAEGLPLPTMDFGYKEPVLNAPRRRASRYRKCSPAAGPESRRRRPGRPLAAVAKHGLRSRELRVRPGGERRHHQGRPVSLSASEPRRC